MPKVLVTGGNGFIGGHLVDALLARGDEVTCLVRPTSKLSRLDPAKVRFVQGDVTDPASLTNAVRGAEVVYHLAGAIMALNQGDLFRINEGGTRNVVAACAALESPPVVIDLSSMAASGPTRTGRPRTEADPPQPVSHYGRSKLAGELAARQFAGHVPISIVRPPIVFGEGDPYSISVYRPVAKYGIHFGQGLARNRFSMVHAADMVQALILIAERGRRIAADPEATQGIYFVASDEHPLFGDWGRMIAAGLGRSRVLIYSVPGGYWLWGAAAVSELWSRLRRQPAIFNFDKLREIRGGWWWCDDAALRQDTDFVPAAPLADRIRQTAQWYRHAGWL